MRFPLRHRVLLILVGFVLITGALGLIVVWYTFRMEALMASITEENLLAFHHAEALEKALMKQKGLVAYFILDGNPAWLSQQEALRRDFQDQLARIQTGAGTNDQGGTLAEIEAEYGRYIAKKSRVADLFRSGDTVEASVQHRRLQGHFESLMRLCDQFKQVHTNRILAATADSHDRAQRLRIIAVSAILISLGLTLLLAFVFVVMGITLYQQRKTERALEALRDLCRGVRGREGNSRRGAEGNRVGRRAPRARPARNRASPSPRGSRARAG